MLVFRLEHENGIGPYRCLGSERFTQKEDWDELLELSNELHLQHGFSDKHPAPSYFDVVGKSCGCKSFDLLCEWFGDFLDKFAKFGYHIAVYDAILAKSTAEQIVFDKKYAKLVETISIL